MLSVDKLLKEVDENAHRYSAIANDITNSAQNVKDYRDDPFEAQKILIRGMKVQDLAGEYMKLAAQLQCVRLAHKVASKAGFQE